MKHRSRLFGIWVGMKKRCYKSYCPDYKNYGALGVKLCDAWLKSSKPFKAWALESGYQSNLTIDRIDVTGDYEPANCRWVTVRQQQNNRRDTKTLTAFGETKSYGYWSTDERCVVTHGTLNRRLLLGWKPERALTEPARKWTKQT